MSKQAKLLNYLSKGNEVTARQISGSFGLRNPHEAIRQLRSQGNCIYSNRKTMSDGTVTTKYRIGAPSKRMVALANAVMGAEAFAG
jgi:predicted transcriptional regulator